MMRAVPPAECGAALLTVLLLVAVMAVISATALERLTLATRLAGNAAAMEQARLYQLAAERIALTRIAPLVSGEQTTLAGDWHGRERSVPLPQGTASLRVTDGGNCFNVNSLVARESGGALRPQAMEQFIALMLAIGIDQASAQRIAGATADWIDTDQTANPAGAEDAAYSDGRRTPDAPIADAGELAHVARMTPAHWRRLAPWLCALPDGELSPINVNTLLPEQAPLLAMLVPGRLTAAQAAAQISSRPLGGWGSVMRFWQSPALGGIAPPGDTASQIRLKTRWFRLQSRVAVGNSILVAESLLDTEGESPRVVRRRWGSAE